MSRLFFCHAVDELESRRISVSFTALKLIGILQFVEFVGTTENTYRPV